jgi:hypothetical protein
MRRPAGRHPGTRRPAKTLVLFVLLLPVLLSWGGLTIDGGLLMAGHRQAQNAADAAAIASAKLLAAGGSESDALATANTYIQQYNGLSNAPALVSGTTFNVPPTSGPYAGNSSFVEVIVQSPVRTYFVGAGGFTQTPQVKARAVAGFKAVTLDFGVAVLNINAIPGLNLNGQSQLSVNGKVVVNSHGAGYDQNGKYINLGYPAYAVTVDGQSTITATDVEVVGGVDNPSDFVNASGGTSSPLHAGAQPLADPLINLPTPTTANGVVQTYWGVNSSGQVSSFSSPQDVNFSSQQSVTLSPGIYKSITISGQVNLTLKPGVYVMAGGGFTVSGQCTVNGSGVMIYNTGSDYSPTTGSPDISDGNQTPAAPSSTSFGGVKLDGQASVTLTPLSDSSSPFNGVLYYQRRWNTSQFLITGQGGLSNLGGTFYMKWAMFNVNGQGTYNAQFVVGSMSLSGQSKIIINYSGQKTAQAGNIYLVE